MNKNAHPQGSHSYWHHLQRAHRSLAAGDFITAEDAYFTAVSLRESSPGRVFLTETIGDRLHRMLHRHDPAGASEEAAGRWERRARRLREDYLQQADQVVREGLRLAGLRPEDEAEANQPVLERALYLVSRSRLFPAEPRSAVPLLKGLFRTARETGRPFAPDLVRHDLPLTEEDRLWLAAKGGSMLETFIAQGTLEAGSAAAGEWARAVLQLLRREYFGSSGRLEAERSWLEAVSADRLLGQPSACVALYRRYLEQAGPEDPRAQEGRLRILEILANVDDLYLPVPRYREALALLEEGGEPRDPALRKRWQHALDCVGYRQPGMAGRSRETLAWASVGLESDGRLCVVLWWDDQPRDMAFWLPGGDAEELDLLLEPCGQRIACWSPAVVHGVGRQWREGCEPYSVQGLVSAVMEPSLPPEGLDPAALLPMGLAEAEPWSRDWSPHLGHRHLEPPRGSCGPDRWRERPGSQALLAGLLVLAMRSRLERADPSLRAGLRELGRRGDGAAWFLYELVSLGRPSVLALDATFAPWTLPLLWTRPDPWGARHEDGDPDLHGPGQPLQPDLGRHDLALVATGSPAAVLEAWGGEQAKWRVVWDRPGRAEYLRSLAGQVLGPVTLIPRQGQVHDLGQALAKLEQLVAGARNADPETTGLLPIFHWCRLVECHNGDLLDYCEIRDRSHCDIELYADYNRAVEAVPRLPVGTTEGDGWAQQYIQRARKSGLVAGSWRLLSREPGALDARWGVFDGSDASWAFCDSAAVHRGLLRSGLEHVRVLHEVLCGRGHRHLSLLLGSAWMPEVLFGYLGYLLGAYGRAYHLTLQDRRLPGLKLADRGPRPDARLLRRHALAAPLGWVRKQCGTSKLSVLLPGTGDACADFWADVASGSLLGFSSPVGFIGEGEEPADAEPGAVLVLPVLPGLGLRSPETSGQVEDPCPWRELDTERDEAIELALARCALELASHLAGPWSEVVVLDTRWWHMLWARSGPAGQDQADDGPWSFNTALRICGAVDAQPLQLAASGPDHDGASEVELAVDRWLAAHGEQPGQDDLAEVAGKEAVPGRGGVVLAQGPGTESWQQWSDRICLAREQGQLEAWMLMVSLSCDAAWRRVIDTDAAPGASVPGPDGLTRPPAALVWATPAQMNEPALQRTLRERPPVVIHVPDFASWLPAEEDERHDEAVALQMILQLERSHVILHTEEAATPWAGFLQDLLGGRFTEAGSPPAEATPMPAVAGGPHAGSPGQVRLRLLLAGLRALLTDARGLDTDPSDLVSAYELVPLAYLAWFAGMPAAEVALGTRILRWALKVAGVPLPAAGRSGRDEQGPAAAGPGGQSHAVLIRRRFAEMEHVLAGLERNLGLLLPLWLQGLPPGARRWIDLEHPGAEVAEQELVMLDSLLGLGAEAFGSRGLVYTCPVGAINSNRRWIGCDAPAVAVVQRLRSDLGRFRLRLREMMDAAVETSGGFLIDTGLRIPGAQERSFLALGAALGLWRWLGPEDEAAVSLVDLLALADVLEKQDHGRAWTLCARSMEAPAGPGAGKSERRDSPRPSRSSSGSPLRNLRSLLVGKGTAAQELARNTDHVSEILLSPRVGLVVLKGAAGTGRHEALVRGVVAAGRQVDVPLELRVFCPDAAVAAQLSLEFQRLGPQVEYSLEIPESGTVLAGRVGRLRPTVPGRVVVICEAQRFAPELRYKIFQLGREGRLLVTVDPLASEEAWEDLFLTLPRPEQVAACTCQRRAAGKLWSRVKDLFPQDGHLASGSGVRPGGDLRAEYAANLDQCLGQLFTDPRAGEPGDLWRVLAGVRSDLDYLGSSLSARGWAVVAEDRLEPWLAPGPREFMAAVLDLVPGRKDFLLPLLSPAVAAGPWSDWCLEHGEACREMALPELWSQLQGWEFLQPALAHAGCRARVEALVRTWNTMAWQELTAHPVATAYLAVLGRNRELPWPVATVPVALLTPADHLPGLRAPSCMYLCLGSEPPLRHYLQWSRVDERLLVLYQERSPLSGSR